MIYLEAKDEELLRQEPLPTRYDFSRGGSPVILALSSPTGPTASDAATTPARAAELSLTYALFDGNDAVRAATAEALGNAGGDDPQVLDALNAALKDRSPEVRGQAAGALAARGKPGVRRLLEAARAPELEFRLPALEALARLKPLPAEVAGLMREATRSADREIRSLARQALGLGRDDLKESDDLDRPGIRHPAPEPQKPATPEDVPRLIRMLARDKPFSAFEAKHQAKQALIDLGRRAVPALIEALREGPKSIRDDCIELLSQIRPVDEPTIEAIIAATKEPGTRPTADSALKKLATHSPRAP